MADIEPITREEMLLNSIAGEGSSELTPITRQEMYLSAIAGETDLPAGMEPITREEIYYQKILDNGGAGGGGEATGTKQISITQNGVSTHNVKAYATAEVTVNVPNPSTGTKQISQNGTHNVTDYASAEVSVPNSYSASDEGKVVSSGALVSQTSRSVTSNGTYDTTLNDEVVVNVPTGITPTGTKQISITENGTTTEDVTNYANAEITVNVQSSSGGFELLKEVTVTEPVEAVTISFTSDMDGYDCYAMVIDGTWKKESGAGASIFSPSLNGSTAKPFSGTESGGEIHRKFMVARTSNPDGTLQNYRLCVGANQRDEATLTSFDFRWYYTGHTFKAGTVCRIYGAKVS